MTMRILCVMAAVLSTLFASTALANPCVTESPKQLGAGNWYQLVGGPGANATYDQAKAAAAAMSFMGLNGHLATITSLVENDFIALDIGTFTVAWIAGTDSAAEGMFRWDAGPENGQLFWNGAPVVFAAFSGIEPNNDGGNETHVEIYSRSGKWNDNTPDFAQCYVVEYEAIPEPSGCTLGLAGAIVARFASRRSSS